MKTNEAIRSQVCEHCCYELVCSSNRLTEELKEYLYVTYRLVLLIVTGLVYGAASLFFFLCWIFPALGGHRRPGQEDDADPYEKDRARIQEKSQRLGAKVVSNVTHLGDTPHLEKMIGPVKVMLDAFHAGELDAVYVAYTRFINTMKQEPVLEQLLPLTGEQLRQTEHGWDYIYEPDARAVIDDLLVRYVEALVYQSVAENMASEQSARMVAMKAASDNAGTVINELQLVYNKTRQAAITKEISEIVAGAAAV